MSETKEREMRLKQMVIGGVVENRSSMGYERKANSGKILSSSESDFQNKDVLAMRVLSFGQSIGKYEIDSSPNLTPVIFVPLDSLKGGYGADSLGVTEKKGFLGKGSLVTPWEPGTVAIVFKYHGVKLDASNREGNMSGCVLMTSENAKKFQAELEQDPRVLMDLAHGVNGGVIKGYDGQPIQINLAENVTILPNAKLGGDIATAKPTAKFPAGYNPNPIF